MATLRGFLGSKGRFVGVLGLPPQKEMPIIEARPGRGPLRATRPARAAHHRAERAHSASHTVLHRRRIDMARKRAARVSRRREGGTSGRRLLAADFPKWKSVVERSASTLSADSLRRARQIRSLNAQARTTGRRALAPIVTLLRRHPPSLRARNDALARLEKERRTPVAAPRRLPQVRPSVTGGSVLQVFGPPYDAVWTQSSPNADSGHPAADAIQGTFSAWTHAKGKSVFGGAGVGIGFRAVTDLPMAHVRPHFRYNYYWSNSSGFETAHSRALLKIRAIQFGPSGQQTKSPPDEVAHLLWADGTSWFQRHHDEGEDVWPGTVQLDFPLVAGQFYAIWIYYQLFADDAGTNALSWSIAFASLHVRVPFLVVEEARV